ncbi:hypothetical protein BDV41DRAFT_538920, partial [Aspergillus transmontanensis]
MLFDLGSHLFEQTVVLFRVPVSDTAVLLNEGGCKLVNEEGLVDDGLLIWLRYKSGQVCLV